MKKSILFLIAVLPLVASCNKNSKGFVDPFPNDPYENEKIGFGFDSDEKIKRTLTTQESEALDNTLANLSILNPLIQQEKDSEIHIRDYTRAFAGVHGQGYGSYNMMYDEENINSFYQAASGSYHRRRETNSHVKSVYDYDYGQNSIETDYKTIRYLAKDDVTTPDCYVETTVAETDYKYAIERKYEIVEEAQPDTDITVSASIIANDKGGAEETLYFDQSEFIFKPSASDPVAGAFDDSHIIIIREQHDPSGEYELPDGRKYKSAKNTLKVTRLVKNITLGDYYIVEKTRTYTETAITSDVIQPNVPISFLKNPIVIKYQEDIHRFSTSIATDKSTKIIDKVEIK